MISTRYLLHFHPQLHYLQFRQHMLVRIRAMLRNQDELVIATMHEVNVFDVHPMSERAKRVARHLRIPVFDQAHILGSNTSLYLQDHHHQKQAASVLVVKRILENNCALVPEHDVGLRSWSYLSVQHNNICIDTVF